MNHNFKKIIYLATIVLIGVSISSIACSTFCIENNKNVVVGYSMDYHNLNGLVMVNMPKVNKQALLPIESKPMSWTSKYGSITFTFFAKNMPMTGMNEKGLVITAMNLANGGALPEKDSRQPLNALNWVQYQLDCSKDINDVINSNKTIRIESSFTGNRHLHYFVADKKGNCATVELLNGTLVVHKGKELPVKTLTNWTYDSSINKLINYLFGNKGNIKLSGIINPESWKDEEKDDPRFIRLAYLLNQYKKQPEVSTLKYAFSVLQDASFDPSNPKYTRTVWSIAFDPTTMKIYFKSKNNLKIQELSFIEFDFKKSSEPLFFDMNKDITDIKKDFKTYNPEEALNLIDTNYKLNVYKHLLTDESLKELKEYRK